MSVSKVGNPAVASIDSALNATIADVIGNKLDTLSGDSIMSRIKLDISQNAVPGIDSADNETDSDVIGNKADTVGGTSLVSRVKSAQATVTDIVTYLGIPAADAIANLLVRDVVGNKDDTIAGTSLVALIKILQAAVNVIDGYHDIPSQDSTNNAQMRDVVGNKNDLVSVPYSEAESSILAFLHTGYYHVHGRAFAYPRAASAVVLTSATAAWATTGDKIEVIPANTLNVTNFDLHWINVSAISADLEGLIEIFSGSAGNEVLIGECKIVRNAVFSQEGSHRIQIPQQPANTRISCRFSDSTSSARTCAVSFEGHYYSI